MACHHARRGEPFELARLHLFAARSAKVHRSLIDFGDLTCLFVFLPTNVAARAIRQPTGWPQRLPLDAWQ